MLAKVESLKGGQLANVEPVLNHVARQAFHNTSRLDFPKLTDDPNNIAANLAFYINSFSSRAREIIEYFGFEAEIEKLDKADRLYLVVKKFAEIDLHPDAVSNVEMGYVFEELVTEVQRGGQRDRRRPLHAARGHPPHGQPALRARHRGADQARHRAHPLRPRLRHRRHAQRRRGLPARAQPAGAPGVLRPGVQPRVLRHLRQRPDDEGPEPREHQVRRQLHRRRSRRHALRLPARQPALRRRVEAGGALHPRRGRGPRLRRPLRRRPAAHQRRLLPLPAAHDQQDEARGLARGDGLQRLAAVHRRRRLGREQHPPLDHRERLARGDRRAARPALLQHRHQHVLLDRDQPQAPRAPRQGAAHRRERPQPEDAQEPRQQAQRAQRRAHRRGHAHLRRVRRGRALQDLRQRGLRLPQDHRRATACA